MIHGKKRNGDLFKRLTESWGYSKPENEEVTPLDEEMAADTETVTEEEEVQEEGGMGMYKRDEDEEEKKMEEGVFDANHYCIHHGGVHHNGSIEMAEAIQHVKPDAKGHISHYDMKLTDGTILENVAAEDIQVTNASLAQEHVMKRDHDAMKDKDEDDDKVEERARGRQRAASPDPARDDDRTRPMEEAEHDDEEKDDTLEEAIRRVVVQAISKIKTKQGSK